METENAVIGNAYIASILLASTICFVAGFYTSSQFEKARQNNILEKTLKQKHEQERLSALKNVEIEQKLEENRDRAISIRQKAKDEIVKIVYRDCVVSDGVVQAINDTVKLYAASKRYD